MIQLCFTKQINYVKFILYGAYKLDYLVTWNCKHIANAQVIHRLMVINQELGMATPVIATPEFLLDVTKGDGKC